MVRVDTTCDGGDRRTFLLDLAAGAGRRLAVGTYVSRTR